MIKLIFPIYYTQEFKTKASKTFLVGLNWYRNAHHMLSNKVKAHYHDLVKNQIGKNKFDKVTITYHVYAGRNGTDGHNIRAVMEKFICDGLVECGALKDDSIEFLKGDESVYFIDKENPRIEVLIEDYERLKFIDTQIMEATEMWNIKAKKEKRKYIRKNKKLNHPVNQIDKK